MTEKITDTGEIEELAYQIISEEGEMRLGELMSGFRVHDTDAPIVEFQQALYDSGRLVESDGYWYIDENEE